MVTQPGTDPAGLTTKDGCVTNRGSEVNTGSATVAPWFSIFFENPLVTRENRHIDIRIVRFRCPPGPQALCSLESDVVREVVTMEGVLAESLRRRGYVVYDGH
jgi:hypothetical protein